MPFYIIPIDKFALHLSMPGGSPFIFHQGDRQVQFVLVDRPDEMKGDRPGIDKCIGHLWISRRPVIRCARDSKKFLCEASHKNFRREAYNKDFLGEASNEDFVCEASSTDFLCSAYSNDFLCEASSKDFLCAAYSKDFLCEASSKDLPL